MDQLSEVLSAYAGQVDEVLERLIPDQTTEPAALHAAIRWSLFAGGKRIRPGLVFLCGETYSVPISRLLCTAGALEMIHTFSLIHDDLPAMDNDDLRRGRLTCHRKFGEAAAILAGDALQVLAFKAIAEDESLDCEIRIRLVAELAAASGTPTGMVAGQQMDLAAEGRPISVEELDRIHSRKTGALITAAARAGAIIGNAPAAELEAISRYAARLGLLFQITDDLLDVSQETERLGKTAGKDVSVDKATYPRLFGIERSRELARGIYAEAVDALEVLGRDTNRLSAFARLVLERTR